MSISLPMDGPSAPAGRVSPGEDSRSSGRPDSPPPCLHCGGPVKPRAGYLPETSMGRRLIDGVEWCWFCSRSCTGKRQGQRSAREQRMTKYFAELAEGRSRRAKAERMKTYEEDVKTLLRYGVPRVLAVEILDRVYRRGNFLGYAKNYKHHVGKFAKRKREVA